MPVNYERMAEKVLIDIARQKHTIKQNREAMAADALASCRDKIIRGERLTKRDVRLMIRANEVLQK